MYRNHGKKREYAILYRKSKSNRVESWHLPKGTLHTNETLEQCARREIREESGFNVKIICYLGALHRLWESKPKWPIDKTMHFFLALYQSGNASDMDHEHDEVVWLPAKTAIECLSKGPKDEAEIIRRAEIYLG